MSSQNPPSTKKSAARYDITFEDVCMMYPNGNEALKDVNLTIRQGEFVFIVGRSGAGKTTLTKLLLCEERVSSGRLHIGPYKLEKLPRRRIPYLRRKMGVVFQDFRLFPEYTVQDNILIPFYLDHRAPDEQMLHKLTGILGIGGKLHLSLIHI